MTRWIHLPITCCVVLLAAAGAFAAEPSKQVVVELFTSQGCPACPPAEAFMRDLAARDDVIALEFHIDYFDYTGWTDPFGRAAFTRRWREYARATGARYEYTPFMVIDGRLHQIGSRRDLAEQRILQMRREGPRGPHLKLGMADGNVTVSVEGGATDGTYDILLATYESGRKTLITAGENKGRTAINANVVRGFERVGQWNGAPVELRAAVDAMPDDAGCAVLLQRTGGGPILAAARMEFGHPEP